MNNSLRRICTNSFESVIKNKYKEIKIEHIEHKEHKDNILYLDRKYTDVYRCIINTIQ